MSKGLEALERLFKDIEQCSIDLARADLDDYKLIERALKALEIINSANLNVICYGYIDDKDVYALRVGELEIKYIQREEYDLLKEVLL